MTQTTYTVRVYGDGTYGLGEEVIPGVLLFRHNHYGLTKEELDHAIYMTQHRKETKGGTQQRSEKNTAPRKSR